MNTFKVGDKARVIDYAQSDKEFPVGTIVEAIEVESENYAGVLPVSWQGPSGKSAWLYKGEVEPFSEKPADFIINGSSMLFPSQEEAENYALHSGNYTDGCTVEIAQVVRRAVVKRTVSVSLEDVQ